MCVVHDTVQARSIHYLPLSIHNHSKCFQKGGNRKWRGFISLLTFFTELSLSHYLLTDRLSEGGYFGRECWCFDVYKREGNWGHFSNRVCGDKNNTYF